MAIDVTWGDEPQTFVVITVPETYTVAQFVDAVDRVNGLMDTVDHPVSVVVDFSSAERVPASMLTGFRQVASRMGHPNSTRTLVVVGAERGLRTFLDIFSKVFRRIRYAGTFQEAERLLDELHAGQRQVS